MMTPRKRYINDPVFHAIVDSMAAYIDSGYSTPSDLRDAAIVVSLLCQEKQGANIFGHEEVINFLDGKENENHDWYCGCGHWNGCNLSVCAMCGRTPGESLPG